MTKQQIGSFIHDERLRQKLSQKALANKAGFMHYQVILEIEQGQVEYGIGKLIKVVEALGFKIIISNTVSKHSAVIEGKWEEIETTSNNFVMDFTKAKPAQEEKPEPKKEIKKIKSSIWKR